MAFSPIAMLSDSGSASMMITPRKRLILNDISSSFEESNGDMSLDKLEDTPTRPGCPVFPLQRGKLGTKALPLSPLINRSTNGKLENHGFVVVRKRRSLTTSSPRIKRNHIIEDKENFELKEDNLCSVESDEDDEVFSTLKHIIKKPQVKIDRAFLKRKSPETGDTPQRRRRCLSLSSPPKSKLLMKRDQDRFIRRRSKSVSEHNVPAIIDVPLDQRNLIGDFSAQHSLPTVPGKHTDCAYITVHTLAKLLLEKLRQDVLIIDARYPYEFKGGHVATAHNFYHSNEIDDFFFTDEALKIRQKSLLVFHCEFSSERGPRQLRHLRARDRHRNPYPQLYYPEIYLLKGGYKEFFAHFKNLCEPQTYLPMLSETHHSEYKLFRRKAKTIPVDEKYYA